MHAVSVESGEGRLAWVLAAHIERYFAPLVPHHEFAAGIDRGQYDHEGGEHAGALFSIPMAYKKIALAIDEKLVELCGDRFGYAKACCGFGNKGVQTFLPAAAGDANTARVDLPSPPDFFVVHGLGATAKGRTLRGGDQLLSLCIEKGRAITPTPSTSSCGGKTAAVPAA